jgi:dihydrofolate reductase
MATVITDLSMSLDGFVALPSDEAGPLFDWYTNGDVVVQAPDGRTLHVSEASARHLRMLHADIGSAIVGRRLFDFTGGWGGTSPLGCPVFVVTHTVPEGWPRADAPFTFVTDGVASAVAQARTAAGEGLVEVSGPNIIQQCLNAGLIDEVRISLVPVLLGDGVRMFTHLKNTPITLEGPTVIEGSGVTHLSYRVRGRKD